MKKIILQCMMLILATPLLSKAQPPRDDPRQQERVEALEIAFISRKLALTPDEAQKFWPIYNEYKRDLRQVMMAQRSNPERDLIDMEQKMVDVRKKYKDRFVGCIGQPRMNKLFSAEREFRGVLMNQLKNRPMNQLKNRPQQRPMMRRGGR